MKVYLIETSSGSYDDYYTYIKTGFLDKAKAEKYVEKYNNELESDKIQGELCNGCGCGKYQYLSQVIRNCKLGSRPSNISEVFKLDGYIFHECDKKVDSYYSNEKHPAIIKEIEIVE